MTDTDALITTFAESDLPDSCFAYVPDDAKGPDGAKSKRKLRLCSLDTGKLDAGIVGAAKAALGKGFRGNRVSLPDDARAGAIRKVNAAAKALGLEPFEGSEDDTSLFAVRDNDDALPKLHIYQPASFVEPPEWSPFLPVPGVYQHPIYGELDFTPATYERILTNFRAGVYQDRLPVNTEHDPHSAGAVGWIVDLRLADSGAIEAKVEWNERGRSLIEGDRFRYVSAEVMPQWSDPVDPELRYQDVAIGMALTTRPYFKERVLAPLAASDAVITRTAGKTGKEQDMGETKPTRQVEATPEEQPTEQDTVVQITERIMAELTEKLGEKPKISDPIVQEFIDRAAKEVAQLRATATEREQETISLREQNTRLIEQHRVKVFSDEVLGRSEANGTVWVGDVQDHTRMCVALAEKFGSDSWELAQYIKINRAHAGQIKAGKLFSEIGTSRGSEGMSPGDKIEMFARQLRANDSKLSFAQAYARAVAEHPDLYEQSLND